MKYLHVGINVTNLEDSFTMNVRDKVEGNQVNHFGFLCCSK